VGASIAIRNLTHGYSSPAGDVPVLRDLELDLEAGAYAALSGPSGAGKSTLLALIGGLEAPRSGSVVVAGTELTKLAGDALARFRRETVGFVFQHFGLLGELTALENIELALALDRVPPRRRSQVAVDLLQRAGLGARADHRPGALSGGERQRVSILRAMVNRPRLVLADEPSGNLDPASARVVIEMLEDLQVQTGCTLVLVTHNPDLASRAHQHFRLENGRLAGS
jgi:ABC-type lipoprotein export system ATPase subunit